MVAIDGINAFFYDTVRIRRADKSIVPYKNITVFDAFKQMLDSDWVRHFKQAQLPFLCLPNFACIAFDQSGGVVITSVDQLAIQSEFRESDKPRYLLRKDVSPLLMIFTCLLFVGLIRFLIL